LYQALQFCQIPVDGRKILRQGSLRKKRQEDTEEKNGELHAKVPP
jgi:hypothetical protein